MYSLASPRVAMGAYFIIWHDKIPYLSDELAKLLMNYQQLVPNTYQIFNAADIVPILPPASIKAGPLNLQCAQVTDHYQIANPGAADTTPPVGAPVSQSGSLTDHVIHFCMQTGDIGNNHSCATTYVPYLAQLADGFQAV